MHQVGLFSTFLCDSRIAGKSQQLFKHRDLSSSLYTIENSFDKYVSININSALLFSHETQGRMKRMVLTFGFKKIANKLVNNCTEIVFLSILNIKKYVISLFSPTINSTQHFSLSLSISFFQYLFVFISASCISVVQAAKVCESMNV